MRETIETTSDPGFVLNWYKDQPAVLGHDAFEDTIDWHRMEQYRLPQWLVDTLCYFRDVENLTEHFRLSLALTPSEQNHEVRSFMDQWATEENVHGETINRILETTGCRTSMDWKREAFDRLSTIYLFKSQTIKPLIGKLCGSNWPAIHMFFGSLAEETTKAGYIRLIRKLDDLEFPEIRNIIAVLAREEKRHAQFYFNMARIKLKDRPVAQYIAKILAPFDSLVGSDTQGRDRARKLVNVLFPGNDGIAEFHRRVTKKIQTLDGFENFSRPTKKFIALAT